MCVKESLAYPADVGQQLAKPTAHFLVFNGVTAPVSLTNFEKSLAKSAPAFEVLLHAGRASAASCFRGAPAGGSGLLTALTMCAASLVQPF